MKVYFIVNEKLYEAYVFNEENIRRYQENKNGEIYEDCMSGKIPYCLSIDKLSREGKELIPKFKVEVESVTYNSNKASNLNTRVVAKEKISDVVNRCFDKCLKELEEVYSVIHHDSFTRHAIGRCRHALTRYSVERCKHSGKLENVYPEMVALSAIVSALNIAENPMTYVDYDKMVLKLLDSWNDEFPEYSEVAQLRPALLRILRLGIKSTFISDVNLLMNEDEYRKAIYLFVRGLEGVDETKYFYIASEFGVSDRQPKFMYDKAVRKVQLIKKFNKLIQDVKYNKVIK